MREKSEKVSHVLPTKEDLEMILKLFGLLWVLPSLILMTILGIIFSWSVLQVVLMTVGIALGVFALFALYSFVMSWIDAKRSP